MVITSLLGYLVMARAFRGHRLAVALGALVYFPLVWYCQLEHFPLVLSTRPWYFSRAGGADGRGLFDGPTDPRAEGF